VSVLAAELDSLPPQQVASQALESLVQHSHVHCAQLQIPVSQQQPPSVQQLEQTHDCDTSVVGLLATLAAIARLTAKKTNIKNIATDFIFQPRISLLDLALHETTSATLSLDAFGRHFLQRTLDYFRTRCTRPARLALIQIRHCSSRLQNARQILLECSDEAQLNCLHSFFDFFGIFSILALSARNTAFRHECCGGFITKARTFRGHLSQFNARFVMSHFSLVAAFALSAIVPLAAFADQHEDSKMKKCAEVCAACQVECDSCFDHCLKMLSEGKKEHQATARMCADCAECCKTCATLCARNSPLAKPMLECCAKCCEECAAACEKFPDDEHMAACAKSCRECAKECRDMLKQVQK
jgi:hypothetical protein